MSLSAIDYKPANDTHMDGSAVLADASQQAERSWVDRITGSMRQTGLKQMISRAAKIHPCIIEGTRVLVYEKGLRRNRPDAYEEILNFAETNGFKVKEDRRDPQSNKSGRTFERRMARTAPMVLLAGALFAQNAAKAEVDDSAAQVMPEVEVLGDHQSSERPYLVRDGKRFISGPHGEVESILAVATEAKKSGKLKRVSTRDINMPQEYVGGYINRYDYQFPESCGGGKYSYYEGEGFGALGYHHGKKVVLDVLVGGGAFAAPKLWGPYDQVLYDNHEMQLMMGDGKKDGMGLLKASYSIGMTAVMADEDFKEYGDSYSANIQTAVECANEIQEKKPVIRHASAGKMTTVK
ncbi:MAG: DUF3579 domain-containing protein [Thiotrichales bacterium]|nr:DUF3579 domain-containing protein [Thiotrichales bacterium]